MKKVTETELSQIRDLQSKYIDTAYELGVNEREIFRLNQEIQELQNAKSDLLKKSVELNMKMQDVEQSTRELTQALEGKYGENLQIHPETGEILDSKK